MDIRSTVRNAIAEMGQAPLPDEDSASLFSAGVIDSFGFVELVIDLEALLGVKVPDAELKPSRFETVDQIVAYFQARR